jgi:hypothetical protein
MQRVILIDPVSKTVTEQFIDGSLQSYYKLLDCDIIETFYPDRLTPSGHFIYCDEEGAFKKDLRFFGIVGSVQPICGKSCIVKYAEGGETVGCTLSVAEAIKLIVFLEPKKPNQ